MPFKLYQCVGLDKLHDINLGVMQTLPDFAFALFSIEGYNKGLHSGREIVRTANSRFRNFKHITGVHLKPFRASSEEKHASMTGKIRRDIAPFLWVALLGLQPLTNPDLDLLLQIALALDHFNYLIREINQHDDRGHRTEEYIDNIQNTAFNACLWLSKSLVIPISAKLHRLMRHVQNHFFQFRCAKRGDSDTSETKHKETKSTIEASNHRLPQIATQILSVRTIAPVVSNFTISAENDKNDSTDSLSFNCDDHFTDSEDE
eukprot:IDg22899t1